MSDSSTHSPYPSGAGPPSRGSIDVSGFFSSPFCRSCGECCRGTEMVLLRADVERLERLGYKREDFARYSGGLLVLRNVNGYCYFYDRVSGLCKVYYSRPLGCRLYPLVFDDSLGVMLDPECPLAALFSRDCSQIREALPILRRVLKTLEEEFGVEYNESLFERSSRRILQTCKH